MTAFKFYEQWGRMLNREKVDAVVNLDRWNKNNVLTLQLRCRTLRQINDKKTIISAIKAGYDKIYSAYFSQSLYNIKTSNTQPAASYTGDFIADLTEKSGGGGYGTLVLCIHPDRCCELIRRLPQELMDRFDISFGSPLSDSGLNSIVFGPNMGSIIWSLYSRVYVFDKSDEWNCDCLSPYLKESSELIINDGDLPTVQTPFDFSRDAMKKYYIAMKGCTGESRADAVKALKLQVPQNGSGGAVAALDVFGELGFIRADGDRISVKNSEPRDLFDSSRYRSLYSFFNSKRCTHE